MQHGRVDMVIVGTEPHKPQREDVCNKIGNLLEGLSPRATNGVPFLRRRTFAFNRLARARRRRRRDSHRGARHTREVTHLAGRLADWFPSLVVALTPEGSPAANPAVLMSLPARLVTGLITETWRGARPVKRVLRKIVSRK